MIGDDCSLLHVAQLVETGKHVTVQSESSSNAAHTLLCNDLVASLSEDSVLQIMSAKDMPTSATLKDPILLTDKRKSQTCTEGNVSDIDLSFLSDGIMSDPKHLNENVVKEMQGMIPPLNLNFLGSQVECSQQPEMESTEGNSATDGVDTVMIDVSQPIQLSQNSLIVVNGQKCILQHDPHTGQVVAYPVKEQRPRKRRGRPRKTSIGEVFVPSEKYQETETFSEEEREKGLLEVVNDDGSLVRRSSRKRKKAKSLKDYETGSLQQELGSDVEEVKEAELPFNRRRKPRGPGRPRKFTSHLLESNMSLENSAIKESGDTKRPRGRPRKLLEGGEGESSQAFLVQTADGQTLVLQVPLSSIPPGTTLQQVAQQIANKLNQASPSDSSVEKTVVSNIENEPALQDHSIGSTTNILQHNNDQALMISQEEICESQEITLECDQSLNNVTSGTNLAEENHIDEAPESLEGSFCLDVSSTTNSSVDAPLLCPFNEHLIDHSFYVMRQQSPPKEERQMVESTIIAVNPSSDPQDLLSVVTEGGVATSASPALTKSKDMTLMVQDMENSAVVEEKNSSQELPVVISPGKGGEVLTVLLQESMSTGDLKNPVLLKTEIPQGPKKCKICAVPCLTEEEMIEHFKAKHPKCICLECNYMNEHPYGIKRHSYRHANEECVCSICNKKYKDSYILKMHVKMVHLPPEVLFQCNICQKEFTRKAHLKRHQRTHAPTRQYQCPLCDYMGCEKSDVTKHSLIHEEPKFKCEVCGKAFRHLKNKELHMKRHSGQRDYKCAACNFYGYTYTDIRKHIERRHSTICPLCNQVFSDPELCKEHKRMGLCQSGSLLEADSKIEDPPTLDDKKEIILFGDLDI